MLCRLFKRKLYPLAAGPVNAHHSNKPSKLSKCYLSSDNSLIWVNSIWHIVPPPLSCVCLLTALRREHTHAIWANTTRWLLSVAFATLQSHKRGYVCRSRFAFTIGCEPHRHTHIYNNHPAEVRRRWNILPRECRRSSGPDPKTKPQHSCILAGRPPTVTLFGRPTSTSFSLHSLLRTPRSNICVCATHTLRDRWYP